MKMLGFLPLLFLLTAQNALAYGDLFEHETTFKFTLKAPFKELFSHRISPYEDHPVNPVPYEVDGVLSFTQADGSQKDILVTVKMRGNSSQDKDECHFPKLKLLIKPGQSLENTEFAEMKKIQLATHCANVGENEHSKYTWRPWNGKMPYREIIAYDVFHALGIATYRTRKAQGSYYDGDQLVIADQQAFFLETVDDLGKRLEAKEDDNSPVQSGPLIKYTKMSELEVAKIYYAEALIHNHDWCLQYLENQLPPFDIKDNWPFYNMKALKRKDGQGWIAIPYDFDLSGFVSLDPEAFPSIIQSNLEAIGKVFSAETRRLAFAEVAAQKENILKKIDALEGDEPARKSLRAQFESMFNQLQKISQ